MTYRRDGPILNRVFSGTANVGPSPRDSNPGTADRSAAIKDQVFKEQDCSAPLADRSQTFTDRSGDTAEASAVLPECSAACRKNPVALRTVPRCS